MKPSTVGYAEFVIWPSCHQRRFVDSLPIPPHRRLSVGEKNGDAARLRGPLCDDFGPCLAPLQAQTMDNQIGDYPIFALTAENHPTLAGSMPVGGEVSFERRIGSCGHRIYRVGTEAQGTPAPPCTKPLRERHYYNWTAHE